MNIALRVISTFVACLLLKSVLTLAQASEPAATDPLDLNPATGCMEGVFAGDLDASQRLVPASAIIESLRGGNCVRLDNAVIQGALDLTSLPVNGIGGQGQNLVSLPGAFVAINSVFEAEFNAAATGGMSVRFSGPAVFSGTQFAALDMTGAHFARDAYFVDARFTQNAKFDGARFEGHARFQGAEFQKTVMLSNIQVNGELSFEGAVFRSLVRGFGGRAAGLEFDNATFETSTDFSRWRADWLSAQGTNFNHTLDLGNSVWTNGVNLQGARFGGNADFDNSAFMGSSARFAGTVFEKNANFARSRFDALADFSDAAFMVNVVFSEAEFYRQALFLRATLGIRAQLANAKFYDLADFGAATFKTMELNNAAFYNVAPRWDGASINGEIKLDGLRSYTPWQVEHEGLSNALKTTPYFVFDAAPDPRLGRLQSRLELIALGVAALAVGVIVLLAREFGI